MKPGDKGLAAVNAAMRDAKPGRYEIDERNAAIDVFAEVLSDLVVGNLAARCTPQDVASVLFRFGRTVQDEHLRRQHVEAMAKQDAARRAVILTETPAEDLRLVPRGPTPNGPYRRVRRRPDGGLS